MGVRKGHRALQPFPCARRMHHHGTAVRVVAAAPSATGTTIICFSCTRPHHKSLHASWHRCICMLVRYSKGVSYRQAETESVRADVGIWVNA